MLEYFHLIFLFYIYTYFFTPDCQDRLLLFRKVIKKRYKKIIMIMIIKVEEKIKRIKGEPACRDPTMYGSHAIRIFRCSTLCFFFYLFIYMYIGTHVHAIFSLTSFFSLPKFNFTMSLFNHIHFADSNTIFTPLYSS